MLEGCQVESIGIRMIRVRGSGGALDTRELRGMEGGILRRNKGSREDRKEGVVEPGVPELETVVVRVEGPPFVLRSRGRGV